MAGKSRILIIGGTGYIGKYIVPAAVKAGHPTFALVRESSLSNPSKSPIIQSFKNSGVTLIYGDMHDNDSLVKAIKQVDVVISTVGIAGIAQFADQLKIIAAIKEAGNNIKRFIPSEFGNDVDRVHSVEPATAEYAAKVKVRRAIEAVKVPYTYVCSHCFDGYFLPTFVQPGATAPPRDKVVIIGDGNVKAIFNKEEDVATYTIKAVDDPRTLNKTLFIKPPGNILSLNELVSLWENKIAKKLERTYIPGDQVLKDIKESLYPTNLRLSKFHCLFVNGDQTNFEIEPSFGVEASELYPDVKYTTVDEYLNKFV